MLSPGTKIRTTYTHSETGVVLRKSKHKAAADARYFGSQEKAAEWHRIKLTDDGAVVMIHRSMMALCND